MALEQQPSPPQPNGLYPARYGLLDSFRGLAALAVVIHHAYDFHIGTEAVMVFFVISGYCIAAASESTRRAGLGWRGFMWRRLRRIYPPYFFSLVLWAATRLVKLRAGGRNDLVQPTVAWLQNLSLTQWLTLLVRPAAVASDNPTLFVGAYWSLGYEEQFYLVMGLLVTGMGVGILATRRMVLALSLISLAWIAAVPHLCHGIFIEYWAPFGLGAVVFYRLCGYPDVRTRRILDVILVATVAVAAAILWRGGGYPSRLTGGDLVRSPAAELLIAGSFALGLVALRPLDQSLSRRRWFVPLRWLGTITYSVYLTHMFLVPFAAQVASRVWGTHGGSLVRSLTQVVLVLAVGTLFWYLCERPFLNPPLTRARNRVDDQTLAAAGTTTPI